MKFTGERVVPTDMHRNVDTYQQHLLRYVWALKYVVNKRVLDAACGTGYGTALMKTVAKSVCGADISEEALKYAVNLCEDVPFLHMDLNNPPIVGLIDDVIVSFETIEHLTDPQKFIDWCKQAAPVVVGSIPLNCPTEYHLHNYTCAQATDFITRNFKEVEMYHQQDMEIRGLHERGQWTSGMILFVGRS